MSGEVLASMNSDLVLVHPDRRTVHERRAEGVAYCGNGKTIKIDYCEMRRSDVDAEWPLCKSAGCKNARLDKPPQPHAPS